MAGIGWASRRQKFSEIFWCFFSNKEPLSFNHRTTLCGALLVALTVLMLAMPHSVPGAFGIGYGVALDRFVALACAQGVVYLVAVFCVLRGGTRLGVVLGVAVLLRLMVVVFPPFLSNDIYRYIWDGWVQLAGINPYRYLPVDAHLAFLRDARVYPSINRASTAHTIYPPAAELFFALAAGVTRLLHLPPVLGMKLFMLGIEGVGMGATLRLLDAAGLPRHRILIYAWNPLPLWEFAGSGHVDAIAIGCIGLALLAAAAGRRGFAAAALAGGVLAKFLPGVLAPALWRRWDWKFAGIFVGLIVLLYLPYLSVGAGVFGFLPGYTAQEGLGSGQGVFLAALFRLPIKLYFLLLAILLLATSLAMQARPDTSPRTLAARCLILGGILLAGLAPHYPWYYGFMLIPACLVPAKSALYLTTASFLLYLNPGHVKLFWPAWLFLPFIFLALHDLWSARKGISA